MLVNRIHDTQVGFDYEVWTELGEVRFYDIDVTLIVEGALEYMTMGSVWCLEQKSNRGNTNREKIEALNNGGCITLFDARRKDMEFLLTREKLVGGIKRRLEMAKTDLNEFIHKKADGVWRLSSPGYDPRVCDEIVQLAVFGQILYV